MPAAAARRPPPAPSPPLHKDDEGGGKGNCEDPHPRRSMWISAAEFPRFADIREGGGGERKRKYFATLFGGRARKRVCAHMHLFSRDTVRLRAQNGCRTVAP